MKTKKYNILDLFAGCGGLSNGFEQTKRFNIVAANEFWEPAQDTYVKNHPQAKMIRGDVTEENIKEEIYKTFDKVECDVIVGGPPCQAYSNAGFRDPTDPRGKLFEDYVEIVDKLKPKVFVLENVKGILSIKHTREDLNNEEKKFLKTLRLMEKERQDLLLLRKRSKNNPEKYLFQPEDNERLNLLKKNILKHKKEHPYLHENVTDIIKRRFEEIGYKVNFKLHNTANYGVPQKRERVIFLGVRDDIEISFPESTHFENPEGLFTRKPWLTVREAIDDIKDSKEDIEWNHIITNHSKEFEEKIKNTEIGESALGYSDAFFRNPPDLPSRTVKENHGGVLIHYEKNRVMTPRELARLQSFSDDFIFEGTKSSILKQIGNAVPPLLGKAIGEMVAKMLDENYS
jgi:DNA (cytosine-5)-methyltransferase 1